MKVTEKQAQGAANDINEYFNPKVPSELRDIIGTERMYSEPIARWNDVWERWEIWWENGPEQWAHRFNGAPSEESVILTKQAAQEFGFMYKEPEFKQPLVLKNGIQYESLYSFGIYLYKDNQKIYN
jgi:hypothetical protein